MEPLNHQMMGYDRAASMFSPDGRLLQVEYAKKTVTQGSTTVGILCKDGVVLVAAKKLPNSLIIPESVEKIYEIDNHIAATFAGITSDARVLIERSQVKAQQHKVTYETNADTLAIVKDISDLKQYTTQSGALRPFGCALIVAGVDVEGPSVYVTDPTGIYFKYKAVAIGEHDKKVEEILEKEYKDSISMNDAIKLAARALKETTEEVEITLEAIKIPIETKKIERVQL
jgi:proteasome alpha subunit